MTGDICVRLNDIDTNLPAGSLYVDKMRPLHGPMTIAIVPPDFALNRHPVVGVDATSSVNELRPNMRVAC